VSAAHRLLRAPRPARSPNAILVALAFAALPTTVLQSVMSPAFPAMERAYHVDPSELSWVVTSYLLTSAVATPITGKLGAIVGKRRALVGALVVLAAGAVICGIAPSVQWMIVGRFVQGLGGGIFPVAFGVIREQMPPERVGTSVGLISALFGVGGISGIVLAGPVVDHLGFHWLFWIALVVIAVSIALTIAVIPESTERAPAGINWAGAALMSAMLITLLVGLSEGQPWGWFAWRTIACFGAAVVTGVLWVLSELHHREPVVDMRVMVRRTVWRTNVAGLLLGFALWAPFALTPLLVQSPKELSFGMGLTATHASLLQLPGSFMVLFAGPLAGWLDRRVGSRVPMVLGPVLIAASMLYLALHHSSPWDVVLIQIPNGIGAGFSLAAIVNLVIKGVSTQETAVATGVNQISRQVGGAFGAQIIGAVLAAHLTAFGYPSESIFVVCCIIDVAVILACALVALTIPIYPVDKTPLNPAVDVSKAPAADAAGVANGVPARA
jgi:EmrB/QacA subfamily drug resistance transporter